MPVIRSNSNSTAAVDAGRSESSATVSRKKKRTTKNKKLGLVDRLVPVGKYMCRMVSFNWNICQTLDQGLAQIACALPEEEKDLIQGATDKDKGFDRCWDELIKIAPYVPDLVMNCDAIDLVEMTFDYAKTTSRAEDNSKFKKGVASWRTWSPPLPKGKKGRGFAHPECQRMLCPISVNFADPKARDAFVLEKSPPATHHVWPQCAYSGYTGNIKNPGQGFLRSGLIKQGALSIMHSPSEAKKLENNSGLDRGTRPGFADMHAITQVTRPFLAYVATLLRYSLSDEEAFRVNSPFNYGQYYTDILEYLEDPIFQDTTDELLEWWDREIFPDAHHARQNPDLSGFSMIKRMRAGLASSDTEDAQSEAAEFQEVPLE
ncbi:hypothetical protein BN14_11375 [Rhizoctonia solani AG-1 IB]|uniref:Uncharacterized protein n=1 Tax=Thanatephorus cucumeris (strain AG1-IB / isolate 7/3/14) TaxID=1108050 RepID=M5CCP8_THACB|nr:hypothetical protein BN14_11375 [Rhizoctonia solani AG-1 IB]